MLRRALPLLVLLACSRSVETARKVDVEVARQAEGRAELHVDAGAELHVERHEARVVERDPETRTLIERWDKPVAVPLPDGGVVIAPERHERKSRVRRGAVRAQRQVDSTAQAIVAVQTSATADSKVAEQAKARADEQAKAKTHVGPPWWAWTLIGAGGVAVAYFLVRRYVP